MMPLDTYYDHAQRPRNMGRMLDAHGVGNVGSIVSGRALRWFMTIEADRVAAAKFQVFACQEQVAAASILSELVVGKTLAEARALGHQDIAAAVDGLPMAELPPQLWGIAGLHDALATLDGRDGLIAEVDAAGPAVPLVCRCHGVDEATIKELIRGGAQDMDALMAQTAAGSGCGTCRRDMQRLLEEVTQEAAQPAAPPPAAGGAQGRVALMRQIGAVLQPLIDESPLNDAQLWDMRGQQVVLRVPADSDETAREQLQDRGERRLKDEVDPLLTLIMEMR